MRDFASYTHLGRYHKNCDALRYSDEERFAVILCDGLNGMPSGELASAFCADTAIAMLTQGKAPDVTLTATAALYAEAQCNSVALSRASTTACALLVENNTCQWANIGDSRLYHFSDGSLEHMSVDDSRAYAAYRAGEITYPQIRLHTERSQLSASIGDGRVNTPHSTQFQLKDGDGLLVCSDGFWQYVYETEMELDFIKTENAQNWLDLMLIRLVHRSMLDGDNLTIIAYRHKGAC